MRGDMYMLLTQVSGCVQLEHAVLHVRSEAMNMSAMAFLEEKANIEIVQRPSLESEDANKTLAREAVPIP
jgi:hypothetical protein